MQSESSQDQIDTLVFNQLRSGFEAQSDTSLSACIKQGQHLAISGVSGCGKSSLLQVIAGLKAPQSGSVTFNNQLIDVKALDLWRQSICYFPQQAVMGGECVRDVLHLPWRLKAITYLPLPNDDLCLSALSQAGITVLLDKPIDTLSGGEKQRVAIARGILMQRKVWLMDEPTSALDPAGRDKIIQLLVELSIICISVSHDPVWLKGATQVHTMHLDKERM
ncbi:ABC transporter ATP-binding protein [Photobacterium lucens]|uniref:ABC transporter ATP-binding protein n=1 Tax=Photobacterium lucens TaxID=2562949 RepID=UPI00136E38E2|nr:ATP-binding cassette domain-containing protein [Photobacterium lucens]MBP2699866.1 ATP-binding cassette domain-containing protein [Vibrio parahaemolyticus]MZG58760.1 ATP-binding cassette domain-containing protein [Photobacterium lucens]MZG82665.1 ATP-binding cassette domain-containing protein [Photobacterium lucens]